MPKLVTHEDWLKRFAATHGDLYDYSETVCIAAKKPIKVICKIHGDFPTTPDKHYRGGGCPGCNGGTSNIKYFLINSKIVHGDLYDYSLVDYKGSTIEVDIICKIHGVFQQTPSSHLSDKGCQHCGGSYPCDTDGFIAKARQVKGLTYDYSLVSYTNSHTKVNIVCPDHGVFEQAPTDHLNGQDCPTCADIYRGMNIAMSFEEFVREAKIVHGDKYTYHEKFYKNRNAETIITCPVHGNFPQQANNHLMGKGCRDCADHGFKRNKDAWFYIINAETFSGFGITNNLKERLKTHHRNLTRNNIKYRVFGTVFGKGDLIRDLEREVEKKFKPYIVNTGIEGFVKEAVKPEAVVDLLNFVERYINENRPEGRSKDT